MSTRGPGCLFGLPPEIEDRLVAELKRSVALELTGTGHTVILDSTPWGPSPWDDRLFARPAPFTDADKRFVLAATRFGVVQAWALRTDTTNTRSNHD